MGKHFEIAVLDRHFKNPGYNPDGEGEAFHGMMFLALVGRKKGSLQPAYTW